jgi:MraZ protein
VAALDRFVSHFTNRLDAKGRVSIPASFRAVMARDGYEGLYVHPSLDAEALDCGGFALVREIDAVLSRFAAYSNEHDVYSTALLGDGEVLKVDPEGRIILPDRFKAYASMTSEVTFVGQGYKFQIWEPGRFRAHLEEARNQVRELRKRLGSPEKGAEKPQPRGAQE